MLRSLKAGRRILQFCGVALQMIFGGDMFEFGCFIDCDYCWLLVLVVLFLLPSKHTRMFARLCMCDRMGSNVPECIRRSLHMWTCVFVVRKGHFSMRDCVLCSRASNTHGREGLLSQLTVANL